MRDSSSDSNDGNVSSTSNTVNLSGASRIETVQSGLVCESILDCALIACDPPDPSYQQWASYPWAQCSVRG